MPILFILPALPRIDRWLSYKKVRVWNKNFTTKNDNFWQKEDTQGNGDLKTLYIFSTLQNSKLNGMVFAFPKVVNFRFCEEQDEFQRRGCEIEII